MPHPAFPAFIWHPAAAVTVPAALRERVFDAGSLTHKLQQAGHFRVQLLHQSLAVPTLEEQRLLHLPLRQYAQCREVLLWLNDQPVVYARSILPLSSLNGANRVLGHMSGRSLGAALFQPPTATRSQFWLTQRPLAQLPFSAAAAAQCTELAPHYALQADTLVTGRQSLFIKRGKPLLVAEFFLRAP